MLVQLDIEADLRGALSDTSDIHGPIPLTREGPQVGPVGVLDICFVQLEASPRLAHAVP